MEDHLLIWIWVTSVAAAADDWISPNIELPLFVSFFLVSSNTVKWFLTMNDSNTAATVRLMREEVGYISPIR
jgi:hypothetical protein